MDICTLHSDMHAFFCFLSDFSYLCVNNRLVFLSAKKLSDVTVMSVKKALTQMGVTVPKGQSYGKESLVILLGKELFGKGKVRTKDETKVISKDNLVLVE